MLSCWAWVYCTCSLQRESLLRRRCMNVLMISKLVRNEMVCMCVVNIMWTTTGTWVALTEYLMWNNVYYVFLHYTIQHLSTSSHVSTSSPACRTHLSPLNILSSLQNSLVTSQHPLQPAELTCHLSTSSPAYRTHLSPLNILSSLQNSLVTSQHPL